MSTILEQLSIVENTTTNIKKICTSKAAKNNLLTLNQCKDSIINLPQANKNKYTVGIDSFLPKLSLEGKECQLATIQEMNFSGVKDIAPLALLYKFYFRDIITNIVFPDLIKISGTSACENAFALCSGIKSVSFPMLSEICGVKSCYHMFGASDVENCLFEKLTIINGSLACSDMFYGANLLKTGLKNLKKISGDSACLYMFSSCKKLTEIDLGNLTEINGNKACNNMFRGCESLTVAKFPKLVSISGSSPMSFMFSDCTNLTEIHFRYDMKSTIEALEEYSNNFGAENATIYFDLARAELEVTPTPADATVTFYDENGTEIPNPTATEINKYAWSVEENGEHFITVEFHDGSSYVYYRDTINDSSQNTALSNPTYYSAWTTKDTNAPYVTVWTLCDETFSSEILDNNYVVSYKPTGGNTASSSSKPVTPAVTPTSIPETKITNTGQDTKITTYYTDNENAAEGDIVYDINGNQTQYSVESCKNDKILLRRPVFIYNVDVTPSDATVTFTQNSEELDKLSTGEVVEYYAWTTNGITYYTKTDTPVVGEAVYDSNKELVPNKTIIAVDENTGTITIG